MEERVFLNGSLIPKGEAKVSIEDRGLLFGDGIFETMRSYQGRVFRLDRHLKRLFDALTVIHLPIPYKSEELAQAVFDTLKANQLQEAYVRLTITRGLGGRGINLPEQPFPTVIIVANEFVPYPNHLYHEGMKTVISQVRQNVSSPVSSIKSLNFLNNVVARHEAKQKGLDDAILLNNEGFVCEGSVGNVFLIKRGILITPGRESGILPGITREAVMELAITEGIYVEERKAKPSELMGADECFLTNTLMEIMPVSEIEGTKIGQGIPGSLTLHFMECYKNLARKELGLA